MAGSALVVLLVVLAASTTSVFATKYNVYGDAGCSKSWTYKCTYASWATYKIVVGDILVFSFDSSQNSVVFVTKSIYNTCENGVSSIPRLFSKTSPTELELLSPGSVYLVSLATSTDGIFRCFQKLHFTVQSSSTPPSKKSPPPPSAPPRTTPPPTPITPTPITPPPPTPRLPTPDPPSRTTPTPITKSPPGGSNSPPPKSLESTIIAALGAVLLAAALLAA